MSSKLLFPLVVWGPSGALDSFNVHCESFGVRRTVPVFPTTVWKAERFRRSEAVQSLDPNDM